MSEALSQDDLGLLSRLAHRYYVDGRTQAEIAREFNLSRPKVQRHLERARVTGVVDIRIEAPPWLNLDLEAQLRESFQLSDVVISPARADPGSQREAVANSAAQLLERRLRGNAIVVIGPGRDTGEVPRFFRPSARLPCTFVSAMGGSPHVDALSNPNEICHAMAERCGGRSERLYAPAWVDTIEMRDRFLEQQAIRHTLTIAAQANIALVEVDGIDDDCTMVRSGCLSLQEIASLRERGAVGSALGSYVDVLGRLIASAHDSRLIALALDQLRGIETVIAVIGSPAAPLAVLGILNAGVVDALVIDEANARTILDLARTAGTSSAARGASG
ncbi:MAG TPA: sugar-binding domain-containing protein [Propionicimonas sp.]